ERSFVGRHVRRPPFSFATPARDGVPDRPILRSVASDRAALSVPEAASGSHAKSSIFFLAAAPPRQHAGRIALRRSDPEPHLRSLRFHWGRRCRALSHDSTTRSRRRRL